MGGELEFYCMNRYLKLYLQWPYTSSTWFGTAGSNFFSWWRCKAVFMRHPTSHGWYERIRIPLWAVPFFEAQHVEFFSSQGTLQRVCLSECCCFSVFSEALFWVVATTRFGGVRKISASSFFPSQKGWLVSTKRIWKPKSRWLDFVVLTQELDSVGWELEVFPDKSLSNMWAGCR